MTLSSHVDYNHIQNNITYCKHCGEMTPINWENGIPRCTYCGQRQRLRAKNK